jgi:hypothetical protein
MQVPDHTLLAAPYLKYGHQLGDMCSPVEIADHFLTLNTVIWIYWLSLLAGGHGTKESKILHSVDCIENTGSSTLLCPMVMHGWCTLQS